MQTLAWVVGVVSVVVDVYVLGLIWQLLIERR